MTSKERRSPIQNNFVIGAIRNEQGELETIDLRIKPDKFSSSAWRKIASDQVQDVTPKSLKIMGLKDKEIIYITVSDLHEARTSPDYLQEEFIDHLSYLMQNAERVVIQRVSGFRSNKKRKMRNYNVSI